MKRDVIGIALCSLFVAGTFYAGYVTGEYYASRCIQISHTERVFIEREP